MKLVLVQEQGRTTKVASVCDTLEELLVKPLALSTTSAPPRIHTVKDDDCHPAKRLMQVIRQQTRAKKYVKLPS